VSLTSWIRNMFSRAERPKEVALGRNDQCWCGSGKKYKKCHWTKDQAEQREANYAALMAKKSKGGDGITRAASKALPPENTAANNANRR